MEAPSIDDQDLDIFVKVAPFSFVVRQVLEWLDDPGMLAEVAGLRMLSTRILGHSELIQAVKGLSSTVHKFIKAFNDMAGQMVLHLEATKKRMADA